MKQQKITLRTILFSAAAVAAMAATGCQSSIGGQTLPSAWYYYDDVQYYAPGPEFKLTQEAAQQEAYSAEQKLLEAKRPAKSSRY